MNLLQLKYFQEAARYQNITKAAESLHISQPSLSASIRHLEEELEVELFERKGKSIVLSEFGRDFLRNINSVFELLERSQRNGALSAFGKAKSISIGGENSELMLAPYISAFLREHPDVLISFKGGPNTARFNSDIFDLLILARSTEAISDRCMVLSPYRHCILMSTQNPLAAREKVSLNDVREEQFVFVSPTTQRMLPGYRMCQALGFSPKVVCLSDERSIMLALLKNSNFVSVVPEQDALSFAQLGGFAAFPVEGPAERSIIINFEVSRVRPMTAVCREFLCFLLDDPNIRAMNPQLDLSKV